MIQIITQKVFNFYTNHFKKDQQNTTKNDGEVTAENVEMVIEDENVLPMTNKKDPIDDVNRLGSNIDTNENNKTNTTHTENINHIHENEQHDLYTENIQNKLTVQRNELTKEQKETSLRSCNKINEDNIDEQSCIQTNRENGMSRICHDGIEDEMLLQTSNKIKEDVHKSHVEKNRDKSMCRICHEGTEDEILLQICNCKGTIKYVHKTCIEMWFKKSNTDFCNICNFKFKIKRVSTKSRYEAFIDWITDKENQDDIVDTILDMTFLLMFAPCPIVMISICLYTTYTINLDLSILDLNSFEETFTKNTNMSQLQKHMENPSSMIQPSITTMNACCWILAWICLIAFVWILYLIYKLCTTKWDQLYTLSETVVIIL